MCNHYNYDDPPLSYHPSEPHHRLIQLASAIHILKLCLQSQTQSITAIYQPSRILPNTRWIKFSHNQPMDYKLNVGLILATSNVCARTRCFSESFITPSSACGWLTNSRTSLIRLRSHHWERYVDRLPSMLNIHAHICNAIIRRQLVLAWFKKVAIDLITMSPFLRHIVTLYHATFNCRRIRIKSHLTAASHDTFSSGTNNNSNP